MYTLIETGMRRRAVTSINIVDVDILKRKITVEEKGGMRHTYQISKEGITAIMDYVNNERSADFDKWQSPALFFSPETNPNGNGRLTVKVINTVWDDICKVAGVEGKTPHSARHAMGRYIMEKTGNVAAVQRQLGHKNAAYSLQYARITDEELNGVLDGRNS
jgi:integrase